MAEDPHGNAVAHAIGALTADEARAWERGLGAYLVWGRAGARDPVLYYGPLEMLPQDA